MRIPGFSRIHVYTTFCISFSRIFWQASLFWPSRSHKDREKRSCTETKSTGADTHTNSRMRMLGGSFQRYNAVRSEGNLSGYAP